MKTRKQQTDDYKNYTLKESETVRFPDDEEAAWVLDTLSYMGIKDESEGTIFIAPIVYTFYDANKHPIYVGKSINIKERFDWHRRQKYWSEVSYIGILLCDNLVWMDIVEICEINNKMPKYEYLLLMAPNLYLKRKFWIATYKEENQAEGGKNI